MPRRSKSEELLDFEIVFYEKLVRAYPEFLDALLPLGEAYTRRGLYDKGLEIDLRVSQLRSLDPISWYNLACSYSLVKRVEDSLQALRRSLELGYSDFSYLQRDPDLSLVRQSPKYRLLLESMGGRRTTSTPQSQTPQPGPQA